MTIVTPEPTIERDRWGKPMVTPPGGGKKVAYFRCTSFIDVIEDRFNLQKWMQRMVALGLASRPDLLLSVNAHRDDKRALDKICDDAREAAAASAAATTGTALHALTELIDRGQELPVGLPANVRASLDAYKEATRDLKALHIEQFCVLDSLKIGGTPDRIVKYGKEVYIADLKTGTIEWGTLKIASQLAVYARSHLYDISTGVRTEHGASTKRGIVIHLPVVDDPKDAVCTLHWIDLENGWHAVLVARDVREKRALKFNDLTEPFETPAVTEPSTPPRTAEVSLHEQILECTDPDAVRALWSEDWTPDLTKFAADHVAALTGNTAA